MGALFATQRMSFGWSTNPTATTPATTPASLSGLVLMHAPICQELIVKPYDYLNGSIQPFGGASKYCIDADLFISSYNQGVPYQTVDFSTSGVQIIHQLRMFAQAQTQFIQCTNPEFLDIFGGANVGTNTWLQVAMTDSVDSKRNNDGFVWFSYKFQTINPITLV